MLHDFRQNGTPDKCKSACSPVKFLAKKDRRGVHYADPFPGLEHQFVEANGIRQVGAAFCKPWAQMPVVLKLHCQVAYQSSKLVVSSLADEQSIVQWQDSLPEACMHHRPCQLGWVSAQEQQLLWPTA